MEHEKKSAQWSERKGDLLSELRVLPIFIRLIKTDKDRKFIMEHGADKNSGYEGRHIYADDLESAKQKALYIAIEAASKTLADLVAQSNDDHLITMILILKRAMDLSVKLNTMRVSDNFESGGIITNEHSEGGEVIVPFDKYLKGTMQPDPNRPPVKGILDIIKENSPIKFTLNGNVLSIFDNDFPCTIQRGYIKRCVRREINNVTILLECDFFPNSGGIRTFKISDERTYFYCSEVAEKALPVIICTKQESDETNTPEH